MKELIQMALDNLPVVIVAGIFILCVVKYALDNTK